MVMELYDVRACGATAATAAAAAAIADEECLVVVMTLLGGYDPPLYMRCAC